ncbi:hypothetical protein DRE_03701 [Drechslerella stenobrocha 248]|uniref:Large ribosomal subunit protein mL54 n=1 Tax=Drechslerella stenobrocha 248 TaxID=1043628 RepID=W7HTZ9_9PEZI|nr:hypothetical protein DRE_03701 [Drechslerella stenobrocha 248]
MSVCLRCTFRYSLRTAFASASAIAPTRRPFSVSTLRKAEKAEKPSGDPAAASKSTPVSSVAAGTQLKGINYIKKLSDPIALPDEGYPEWLWRVLEDRRPQLSSTPQLSAEDSADLFSKSRARRKMAQKRIAEKEAAGNGQITIPSDYRTDDMPYGSYEESQEAIMEAKRASRARRRAAIKEKNFLGKLS